MQSVCICITHMMVFRMNKYIENVKSEVGEKSQGNGYTRTHARTPPIWNKCAILLTTKSIQFIDLDWVCEMWPSSNIFRHDNKKEVEIKAPTTTIAKAWKTLTQRLQMKIWWTISLIIRIRSSKIHSFIGLSHEFSFPATQCMSMSMGCHFSEHYL